MRVTWQPLSSPPATARATLTARAAAAANAWQDAAILPELRRAVAAAPNDAPLWRALGLAQRNLDAHADALASLRQAVRVAPGDPAFAHALARTTLEAGVPAEDLYERALALAPLDAGVMLGRAAAQFAERGATPAIDGLRTILREHPAWYGGHTTVARLYWLAGAREQIGESFEEALRARPRDGEMWRDYAFVVLSSGDHERTRDVINRARQNLGASRILDLLEAGTHSQASDFAAADRLFTQHLPIVDGYLLHYVRHLLRAGRPDAAAGGMEGFVDRDPTRELLPLAELAWRQLSDQRSDVARYGDTFIRTYDLSEKIAAIPGLPDRLRSLHRAQEQPIDQSLRGGTQTDGPLFSRLDPEIRALRAVVMDAVADYVAALPAPIAGHPLLGAKRDPLRFAGSWSVRLTEGGHHVEHVHPAGWISSALYIAVPDGAEADPAHGGWLSLGDAPSLAPGLPAITQIAPRPGRLVLFPSTMWHRTLPFSAGERLTVAFDIARAPR